MFVLLLRTFYSRLTVSHLFSVVLFSIYIYKIIMAIMLQYLFFNGWRVTIQNLIKKQLKISCITFIKNYMDLIPITKEFQSNILVIYFRTLILVIIFSLRSGTHGKKISITIGLREHIIIKRTFFTLCEFTFLSDSLSLGSSELKVRIKKLRFVMQLRIR
jgi:hypothetical protein